MSADSTPSVPDTADLVEQLAHVAREHGIMLAVAESLTAGALVSAVAAGPRAELWLAGATVVYTIDAKERVLSVRPGTDPCSGECAEQLARGVREVFAADVAVSTTGVGGPDADGEHPPGSVYLGWDDGEHVGSRFHAFDGEPEDILAQTVDAAAALLLEVATSAARRRH